MRFYSYCLRTCRSRLESKVINFFLISLPIALAVVRYHVDVYTGQLKQAETESEVYLCLYGERGDSGLRLLHRSNMPVRFQRGQVSLCKALSDEAPRRLNTEGLLAVFH